MHTVVFDGIVRELGAVSTRRGVFRLLGGAAAMGAGLVLGGESLAKGKSHGKAKVQGHGKGKGKAAASRARRPRARRARRSPSATRTRPAP